MPKHPKNTPKQCASNKKRLCSDIVNVTRTLKTKTHSSESMKKGANCTKVKVLSKDYIFDVAIFY
jgi:hypothetical protein